MPLLLGAALAAAASLAACSSETPSTSSGDAIEGGAEGSPTTRDGGSAPIDDDHHDPFNGVDAGCPVTIVGPRSGSLATSLAREEASGAVPWTNPRGAMAVDGEVAHAKLTGDQTTELLRITGFGFDVPPSARVLGFEVELKRQASDTGIVDGSIELWLAGRRSDRPKTFVPTWPRLQVGTHHYGQAVDTWGDDLSPALVNDSNFGVEMWARRQESATAPELEAQIESLRMTLFYCD